MRIKSEMRNCIQTAGGAGRCRRVKVPGCKGCQGVRGAGVNRMHLHPPSGRRPAEQLTARRKEPPSTARLTPDLRPNTTKLPVWSPLVQAKTGNLSPFINLAGQGLFSIHLICYL